MNDPLEELLEALSKVLELPLHLDRYHACSIQVASLTIQLQLDLAQEHLFLLSQLFELPPGKFREHVLREALKANAAPDPRFGILSYMAATQHLSLHQRYPLFILNGERLANFFAGFLELGQSWKNALLRGHAAPLTGLR